MSNLVATILSRYSNFVIIGLVCYIGIIHFYAFHNSGMGEVVSEHGPPPHHSDMVIFLVRTFPGHFDLSRPFNIITMINSLRSQENPNWVAFLVNTDVSPLPFQNHPLTKIMLQDSRIRVIGVPVSKPYNKWTAGYDTTDKALDIIQEFAAPWIVITNGDNWYDKKFLNYLPVLGEADVVLVNFWSRYQHLNKDLNPVNMSETVCHSARFQTGYVDLGGVIISLTRFQYEKHRFMKFGHTNSQDGMLFGLLANSGWVSKKVEQCLYSHAPNPYTCSVLGGIWWNSPAALSELGDSCMNKETASILASNSIPEPKLEVTPTGVHVLTLPEPYHSQRKRALEKEQLEFQIELNGRLKEFRTDLCADLQKSGFRPDLDSYARLNKDLALVGLTSDEQLLSHFWANGCVEMRAFDKPPPAFFAKPIK